MIIKIFHWLASILCTLAFALVMNFSHLILFFVLFFGDRPRKIWGDWVNFLIIQSLRISGAQFTISNSQNYPLNRPLLIISNHQSMFDIPLIGWALRKHNPKFVAKKELAKHVPFVSMNLRNGAGILIDRSNPSQSIRAIEEYGNVIAKNNYAIALFPEGTRARDGVIKNFKTSGFKTLIKSMPNCLIVPLAIINSWELVKHKMFPVPFGIKVSLKFLPAQEPSDDLVTQLKDIQTQIVAEMKG